MKKPSEITLAAAGAADGVEEKRWKPGMGVARDSKGPSADAVTAAVRNPLVPSPGVGRSAGRTDFAGRES